MSSQTNPLTAAQQVQYLQIVLRRRLWTAIAFFGATLLFVIVATTVQTPIYRATATVFIDMEAPNVLSVSTSRDDSTMGQTNYMTYADYYRTQLEVIQSRRVAEKVIQKLGLEKTYGKGGKDPVNNFLKNLDVEPVKQTRLAKIHFENPDPEQAARIVNEVAYVFVEENLFRAATNEALTLMKNEYLKLKSKETELAKRYKEKFPARVRVREQMAQLSAAIEKELENQVGDDSDGLKDEAPGSIFKRLDQGLLMGGLRPNNIRVQDVAHAPIKPSAPKKILNILAGFMIGLIGGLMLVILEELLDGTVRFSPALSNDKRYTFLGCVPSIENPQESLDQSPESNGQLQRGSHSPLAEAYRAIRTNLLCSEASVDRKIIVVTSPGSGEGKTTTTSFLGTMLAHMGLRVLIVDADLRKPSLHKIFKMDQVPGLSDFLVGKAPFEKVVHPAGAPGLHIIPSGTFPENPAELIGSPKMREFIEVAQKKFDWILLDASPSIPVSDPIHLAAVTQLVLMVAESGKTPREAVDRLLKVFHDVKAESLLILNKVSDFELPAYGYGYRVYSYGYAPMPEISITQKKAGFLNDLMALWGNAQKPSDSRSKEEIAVRPGIKKQ